MICSDVDFDSSQWLESFESVQQKDSFFAPFLPDIAQQLAYLMYIIVYIDYSLNHNNRLPTTFSQSK